ncbi:malonyl-[acyl-carrier protein] O-methyltransferase BioC [Vibrio breoganii]|uniref:Malonyl-[acyl-carrier protein] O-methyltransferase n=1 Tax=Vibrio breoganii TaxID=553239 RepID=A0ABX1UA15_9VIBR|nr:malonyl-ACP O-methyltransferase BioC [Vibrio breoganii]NMO73708.1 malonyl-ACP O-methyltransferase BioC [Vibrio breoganii]NMR70146.1 malonyl-ACP O-methyltransferase BioC [Vibrio breoganii]OCH75935.1 malonyl-[acyl-carrier protein] O-methyltransferase BioC [Vibrio breoganii]OED93552.1 malonyl-[acyl-carrier protein] O-methyltransferase BioC [Vibrio breoganii ZF-29]OEF83919.1 malonyl-[acyl-carrier protein] O-methyltransferase BioC [Vibrio breoganii 1C10]
MGSNGVLIATPEKQAIASAFGRAASNYDQHAQFQRDVVEKLLERLPASLIGKQILDVGCGTGYLTEKLLQRGAEVVALDLSDKMLDQARLRCGKQVTYYLGDAEALPFADDSFDYVVSSLALQWCEDLSVPIRESKRVCKVGGHVLFSTLVEGSLYELKQAWSYVDQYQHVKQFVSEKAIKIALAQSKCDGSQVDLAKMTYWYHSAFELMKDLKGIGATQIGGRSQGLTKKSSLVKLEQVYQQLFQTNLKLPATYQVCLGLIKK